MTVGDAKLDRLHAGLTARERVLLIHHALLADDKEDPAIRDTMPRAQAAQFNHFIALANGILHVLSPTAFDVQRQVEILRLKLLFMRTVLAWGGERDHLTFEASMLVRVPIRASEYETLLAASRDEHLELRDAAEIVADEREITAAVAVRELKAAATAGQLDVGGHARSLKFELGSLYHWLGVEASVGPDWGRAYEVVPDNAWSNEHDWTLASVERFTQVHEHGPSGDLLVRTAEPGRVSESGSRWRHVMQAMVSQLRAAIPGVWGQLLAVELVADELSREFDDRGLLPEEVRQAMRESRADLQQVQDDALLLVGEIAVLGPDERTVDLLRRAVRRDENRFG